MKRVLYIVAALLLVAQFVQPDRTVKATDPSMDLLALTHPSPAIAAALRSACYDCHSNETQYPWYAYVTPLNWWIQKSHVEHGRHHFNMNAWGSYNTEDRAEIVEDAQKMLKEGEMPVPSYTWLHSDARLADPTRLELAAFFSALR
jgi:hypothetical protein